MKLLLALITLHAVGAAPLTRLGAKDLQSPGAVRNGKMTAVISARAAGTTGLVGMAADNAFVFTASKTSIVRMDRDGLLHQMRFEVPGATQLTAIQVDQKSDSVYVTGEFDTQPYHRVVILDKLLTPSSLRVCGLPATNSKAWAMGLDDDHIYTSHNSRFLTRLDKATCDTTGAPATLELPDPNETADVRSLEVDPNVNFLFANTYESPARVIKVDLQSFSVDAVLVLQQGQNDVLAGAESDDTHVFVGTTSDDDKGAAIIKISKNDMKVVKTTHLEVGESTIAAMDSDALSVYITTDNDQQPRVLRLNKETMEVEDRLMLSAGTHALEKGIAAIAHSQDTLYVGSDTTPATFVELNAGSFYVAKDCKVTEWGVWSDCTRPWGPQCGMGTHTRSRTITQHATAFGAPCPDGPHLKEVAMCNTTVPCPEAPHRCPAGSGETYRTDERLQYTAANAQRPSCSNREGSGGVSSNAGACDCPSDKPFWHEVTVGIFRCVDAEQCDADYKKCEHAKCRFLAGRVKVFHHNDESIGGGIRCVHDTGRTGNCHCYCGLKLSSPSEPSFTKNYHIGMLKKGHPNAPKPSA